jgi:hypothetical protein
LRDLFQGISTCNLTGSNQNGLKRRIASRQIKNAECFRIPKNLKIFVSVAIENGFLQNEYDNTADTHLLRKVYNVPSL